MAIKFLGNTILMGKIELLSGMHIGGNKDKLEIGGIDSPVIRDAESSYPYIPGSSLKGKLRMITELAEGRIGANSSKGFVCDCADIECPVCRIFGTGADPGKQKGSYTGPTRIMVRDSLPDKATVDMWECLSEDYLFTEAKTENGINRLTSEANPRTVERVVRGSCFNFHVTVGRYDVDGRTDSEDDMKILLKSLRILEDTGLGGSVSRGYGRVRFLLADPVFVSTADYLSGGGSYPATRYERIDEADRKSLKRLSDIAV